MFNRIFGVVAEYNPFHLGHKYQLDTIRKEYNSDLIIVCMSGHFLQRGIPSIIDKWSRAQMAIECGADLVIEMPVRVSMASSDYFANGAIRILSDLGVNNLCFGVEENDLDLLFKISDTVVRNSLYDEYVRMYMKEGYSYVKANKLALSRIFEREIILMPNTLLAISYIKCIKKTAPNIKLVPIKRRGANYSDGNILTEFASAKSIRNALSKHIIDWVSVEKALPINSFNLLKDSSKFVFQKDFYDLILACLNSKNKVDLTRVRGVKEGLENKILDAALKSVSWEEMMSKIVSKRYTYSTISRILFSNALGIFEESDFCDISELQYQRVLAMSKNGRKYLNYCKDKVGVKPVVNFSRDIKKNRWDFDDFKYDLRATFLYSLQCESIKSNSDYLTKPYIMN